MYNQKKLTQKLKEASRAYYSEGHSIMTDKEYDDYYDVLFRMEQESGIVYPGSPTAKIGYEPVSGLNKVTFTHPARSLDKTKSVDELLKWLGTSSALLSDKMDGCTAIATYKNGTIQSLWTRGDGYVGEDVSHNISAVSGLPFRIPFKEELTVRGEVVISNDDFEVINAALEGNEKYKNARNLASSSLRLFDPDKAGDRKLQFKAFRAFGLGSDSLKEDFDTLTCLGFNVVRYMECNYDSLAEAIQTMTNTVSEVGIATDGLVLALNDRHEIQKEKGTDKYDGHSMAFKWADTEVETTLKDIEWSASATGLLNPVAIFDPVELEGTTVSRASVHNVAILEGLELGIGDKITVYKANMIIPQLSANLTRSGSCVIPETCPVCGGITKRVKSYDTESLYCTNPDCSAKHVGKFVRMCHKDGLSITGVAESTLQAFAGKGWLQKLNDLFHLDEHRDEIINMDRFGEKSYEKIASAISLGRITDFRHLYYALGIPGSGHEDAKILREKWKSHSEKACIMELIRMSAPENRQRSMELLTSYDGIGASTAEKILTYMHEHCSEILLLVDELFLSEDTPEAEDSVKTIAGLTFVVTGTVEHYKNRDALKKEIEEFGGKVAGSVSKKTDYLINNDSTSTSNKNKKARELGIPIITEEEYLSMIGKK